MSVPVTRTGDRGAPPRPSPPSSADAGTAAEPVAVLGLGAMGSAIAGRLRAVDLRVGAWNRTRGRAEVAALERTGVRVLDDARAAAGGAGIVITLLPTAEAVQEVLVDGGVLDALAEGAVWLQMGTIGVEAVERLDRLVRSRRPDVAFVDAPVSGSRAPAARGMLLVLAAGPEAAAGRLGRVLGAIGRRTLWVGPAGTATRLKLVLNTWLAFEVEAAVESAALAEQLGVPPELLDAGLSGSPLASPFALAKLAKARSGDLAADFALAWALKDLDLAAAAAGGADLPVAGAIASRWRDLVGEGHGGLDVAAAGLGLGKEAPTTRPESPSRDDRRDGRPARG